MSVFTPLEHTELEDFLSAYGLGRLKNVQATPDGTENTNFFVSLEAGEYVLTLIERGRPEELPFFIELLERLHQAGLPVPYALADQQGQRIRSLADKPALLQPRLPGRHPHQAGPQHCAELGQYLARLHQCTAAQPIEHPTDRGLVWMQHEGLLLALGLPEAQQALLKHTLEEVRQFQSHWDRLPQANLHADLFRDNALFEGAHLTGVIDFYSACSGPTLYDLAICVNDWCSDEQGRLDTARTHALLNAYASIRPFNVHEVQVWPSMLRIACVRFWISRLLAAKQHAGRAVLIKDPLEFYQRLNARQQAIPALPLDL